MTVEYRDETPFTDGEHTNAEIVSAIRTKKYGKDVREAIAQSLENTGALAEKIASNPPELSMIDLIVDENGKYYNSSGNKAAADGYHTYKEVLIKPFENYQVRATFFNAARLVLKTLNNQVRAIEPDASGIYSFNSEFYTRLLVCSTDDAVVFGEKGENDALAYLIQNSRYVLEGVGLIKNYNSDANYVVSELLKPNEISYFYFAGFTSPTILYTNAIGQIVDWKSMASTGQIVENLDKDGGRDYEFISIASYTPDILVKPGTPHRGLPKFGQHPTVVLQTDNSEADFYQDRSELLGSYGFNFNFAIESYLRNAWTDENKQKINALISKGNKPMIYGGVGANPNPSSATESDWENYAGDWIDWCFSHGIKCPVYATSHNDLPPNFVSFLKKKGFKHARSHPYWNSNRETMPYVSKDYFQLSVSSFDNETTFDEAKVKLDDAISKGESISFLFHKIDGTESYQVSRTELVKLLNYLKSLEDSGVISIGTYEDYLANTGDVTSVLRHQVLSV